MSTVWQFQAQMWLRKGGKALILVIFALLMYHFGLQLLSTYRNVRKARKWGCAEPRKRKDLLPFGLDQVWRAWRADQKMQFLGLVSRQFRDTKRYTFQASFLGSKTIFTADELNIRAMLATQFEDFDIGPTRQGNFHPLLGSGIFTQDDIAWKHSRGLLRPQFSREQVSDLDLEEQHVQNLMQVLDISEGGWTNPVDLQPLFFRLTLDTATEFLFGRTVNSQLAHLQDQSSQISVDEKSFASAFDRGAQILAKRLRLKDKYWLFHPSDFDNACKTCHDFVDHYVRLALENRLTKKSDKYVFLDALAAESNNPLALRSQLLNILLAGRDTTASMLSWLFFSLARDPRRYEILRHDILYDFGTYDNPKNLSFSAMKNCKYLQYCNNETLRLFPVVPLNTRQANKDTTLPTGGGDGTRKIFVPKGMQCDYSVHVMHRRNDIWGPDADKFVPERWESRKVGWEFLPFNGGPRICIGQQFALTEASYVAIRIIQRFSKLENIDIDPVVRYKLGLTSSSGNGVRVRLRSC